MGLAAVAVAAVAEVVVAVGFEFVGLVCARISNLVGFQSFMMWLMLLRSCC